MGEVYAGYDERLDRPVALKRIRSWHEEDETARQRFRHEARAVARLSHPAIVQVFDWVEAGDGDWIVMELVPGVSLRRLLAQGRLAPARAARLARDLLAGLAAAHGAGLIHRDIKAENVMVVDAPGRGEQAKILDFGLAKRFDVGDGASAAALSGGPVGTLTAMSPEQVAGREVDPRSDLFSLGALLYEMTTGVSPFRGETPAATLHRICSWLPPPAHEICPEVPAALSAWIGRLLAKDPRWRPKSAAEALAELDALLPRLEGADPAGVPSGTSLSFDDPTVRPEPRRRGRIAWLAAAGAAVLGVVVLVAAIGPRLQENEPALYVAVPPTVTVSPAAAGETAADLELAAGAVHTALLEGLLAFRGLGAVEPARDDPRPADAAALARTLAADEVLESRLSCGSHGCRLVLRRLRGTDGRLLWTGDLPVEVGQLLETSIAVTEHLRQAYPRRRLRPGVPDLAVRAEDYAAYLRLAARFERREQGFSTPELVRDLERLEMTSPRFLPLPLLAARVLTRRFQETRDPEDLARAGRAVERALAIAPEEPRALCERAHVALVAGDLEQAEETLAKVGRLEPASARRLSLLANLLERQGRPREALARLREAVARRPAAAYHVDLGRMLLQQGEVAAAREALEAALARAPEHYNALSLLAQLELMNGSLERATGLHERLVARSPEATELTNLGTAHLLAGRYDQAASRFRQALEKASGSPPIVLNLADAEFLAGRRDRAVDLYRQVLAHTARDSGAPLLTVRAQALAHLGEPQAAITAVQEALRRDPHNPMTAYEAALVFALVGDQGSALWNARRALTGGVGPRWFSFPWFDPLRSRLPEIAAAAQNAPAGSPGTAAAARVPNRREALPSP